MCLPQPVSLEKCMKQIHKADLMMSGDFLERDYFEGGNINRFTRAMQLQTIKAE